MLCPEAVRGSSSHAGEALTQTDRWREQCPPLTKVNCYSPAQHLVGALVCPPLTHCVHAHAHMYTCEWAHVNMREVKLRPRGAHSTPREHFRETLRRIVT